MIYQFDLLSIFICSITGALASMEKDIDGFGIFVISAVAGIGGGTLRDITLGRHPVFWIADINYLVPIALGAVVAIIFERNLRKSLIIKLLITLDAFALGIFTIVGLNVALTFKHEPVITVIMGLMTGIVGGMLRDILVNEIPFVLRREIYALASIAGSTSFLLLEDTLPYWLNTLFSICLIVTIRLVSVKYKLSLPKMGKVNKKI